jgi:hypothetical protein
MTNHCHLIISSPGLPLRDLIRNLKKFTAKKIMEAIENNEAESRKKWLMWLLKKDGHSWFWKEGYHGDEIFTKKFMENLQPFRSRGLKILFIYGSGLQIPNTGLWLLTRSRTKKALNFDLWSFFLIFISS